MKQIEKYVKFGIENWLKDYKKCKVNWNSVCFDGMQHYNIIECITDKSFIKAIARWLEEEHYWNTNLLCEYRFWMKDNWEDCYIWEIIAWLTYRQAIAIRDNKLEEFITNLLEWLK